MGNVLTVRNGASNGEEHCSCFLARRSNNNEDVPAAGFYPLELTAAANQQDALVSVPNEIIQRDTESLNDSYYHYRNKSSIPAHVDESPSLNHSHALKPHNHHANSEASALKLQLRKARQENKRLIGELKSLRTAYAQTQADMSHWKSQATMLLERAKMFESQLNLNKDNNNNLMLPNGRRSSVISLPALTRVPSKATLLPMTGIREIAKSVENLPAMEIDEIKTRPVDPIKPAFLLVASDSCDIYQQFIESKQVTDLRQIVSISRKELITVSCAELEPIDLIDAEIKTICLKSNENWSHCANFDAGVKIGTDGNILFSSEISFGNVKPSQEQQLLMSIGHFSYGGYKFEVDAFLPINDGVEVSPPSQAFYLSQLNLALSGAESKQHRWRPIFVLCSDGFRLNMLLKTWLKSLSTRNFSVFTHAFQKSSSEDSTVFHAIYALTRQIHELIELKPIIRFPLLISFDLLIADFYRAVEDLIATNGNEDVVIVFYLDGLKLDVKKVAPPLLTALQKSTCRRCHFFIFSANFFEDLIYADDAVKSQLSSDSDQSYINSNNIVQLRMEPISDRSEIEAFANSLASNLEINLEPDKVINETGGHICEIVEQLQLFHHFTRKHPELEFYWKVSTWDHFLSGDCLGKNENHITREIVIILAASELGIKSEDIFCLIPRMPFNLFHKIVKTLVELHLIEDTLSFSILKLRRLKELLQAIGKDITLSNMLVQSQRKLMDFYLKKLARQKSASPHAVADFTCICLSQYQNRKHLESLFSSPVTLHLLYRTSFFALITKGDASSNILNCQKAVATMSQEDLPSDTSRGHLLMSLAGMAHDLGLAPNSSLSILAEAVDCFRTDVEDKNQIVDVTIFCHLLMANIALLAVSSEKEPASLKNGYRSTAERNLAVANKMMTKRKNDPSWKVAADLFSSHLCVIQMQLQQIQAKTNNSETIKK